VLFELFWQSNFYFVSIKTKPEIREFKDSLSSVKLQLKTVNKKA